MLFWNYGLGKIKKFFELGSNNFDPFEVEENNSKPSS